MPQIKECSHHHSKMAAVAYFPTIQEAQEYALVILAMNLNCLIHDNSNFRSLGASTATFGALGLLVGVGLYHAWLDRTIQSGMQAGLPLIAGLFLFTTMGIGGPDVDVLGHALGFTSGLAIGIPVATWRYQESLPAS